MFCHASLARLFFVLSVCACVCARLSVTFPPSSFVLEFVQNGWTLKEIAESLLKMSVWTTSSSAGAGLDSLNTNTNATTPTTTIKAIQHRQSTGGSLNLSTFVQPVIGSEINTSTSSQHFQHVVAAAVAAATSIATGQQQQQHFYPNFNNNNNNNNSSSGSLHGNNGGFNFKRSSISNSASQLPVSSQNSTKVS